MKKKMMKYGKKGLSLTRKAMKNKEVRKALKTDPHGRAAIMAFDLAEKTRAKHGKRKGKSHRKSHKRPLPKSRRTRKKR